MPDYASYFRELTGHEPHWWQSSLGASTSVASRLIRIPTGFGKTVGVASAWLYHRLERNDAAWPNRLVWCLPMRTLVEQTADELRRLSGRYGVEVHVLMGGIESEEWDLHPDRPAILVGTQDMLISAALNRGYSASRARWPLQFGLLNQDALWVMDEVQLMDVGLATSAQLQAIREQHSLQSLRPCVTWWMSATLQPSWLRSVDTAALLESLSSELVQIPQELQQGHFWDVEKPVTVVAVDGAKAIAEQVLRAHEESAPTEYGRITLVVLNTVKMANEVHKIVQKALLRSTVDVRLVHSRFRGIERQTWRSEFLARENCTPSIDRIIIATQVVEAGVDISATSLITELAPWPSLVQRFGRAARYGGTANITIVDQQFVDDKKAAPYTADALEAARGALTQLGNGGIAGLENLERELDPTSLEGLYPYDPMHLLLHRELLELVDTSTDLSGADVDISRFIRSGDERDFRVFWRELPKNHVPDATIAPSREELCAVPIGEGGKWVQELLADRLAWVWDYLDGKWIPCTRDSIYPGQTVLVDSRCGGYSTLKGWTGKKDDTVAPVQQKPRHRDQIADSAHESDDLSVCPWQTIADHGAHVAAHWQALSMSVQLDEKLTRIGDIAARWHDVGKAHKAFVACINPDAQGHPGRFDLAKAPDEAWKPKNDRTRYTVSESDRRPGFRHELASTLAMFWALAQAAPEHEALVSEVAALLRNGSGSPCPDGEAAAPTPAALELATLDAPSFNLAAYLAASHHGKMRLAWNATPMDQKVVRADDGTIPVAGVREGDTIEEVDIALSNHGTSQLRNIRLTLEPATMGFSPVTGASWAHRCDQLLKEHGPFALCFLEGLLRVADIRASRGIPAPDLQKLSNNSGSEV